MLDFFFYLNIRCSSAPDENVKSHFIKTKTSCTATYRVPLNDETLHEYCLPCRTGHLCHSMTLDIQNKRKKNISLLSQWQYCVDIFLRALLPCLKVVVQFNSVMNIIAMVMFAGSRLTAVGLLPEVDQWGLTGVLTHMLVQMCVFLLPCRALQGQFNLLFYSLYKYMQPITECNYIIQSATT